jgi:putative chitinase
MKLNRQEFYTGYRKAFGGLAPIQVKALNSLLDAIEADETVTDPRHIAYFLATTKHECADTWLPITERGPRPYFDKYEPQNPIGRNLGNKLPGDGYKYRGRGFVQLTGRPNYQKMSAVCEQNLLDNPEGALTPANAYKIMSHGFRHGTFTGKRLSDYVHDNVTDYRNARRCINGLDQCDKIAKYAVAFEQILRAAAAPEPDPEVIPPPIPPERGDA